MPSNTIHFAPISSFFALSMASMPLRSNSPDWTTSGDSCASRKNSLFLARADRPQSNVAALAMIWRGLSSNATKMPGFLPPARGVDEGLKGEHGLARARAALQQASCGSAAVRRGSARRIRGCPWRSWAEFAEPLCFSRPKNYSPSSAHSGTSKFLQQPPCQTVLILLSDTIVVRRRHGNRESTKK